MDRIFYDFCGILMKVKKKLNLTVDSVLVEMAKQKLGISISQFLENQLEAYFGMGDDEQVILDKLDANAMERNLYNEKLCHIRKIKEAEAEANRPMEKAMASLNRMHERLGEIGENQIAYIANSNKLEFQKLKKECENNCMNIVPFSEIPKY